MLTKIYAFRIYRREKTVLSEKKKTNKMHLKMDLDWIHWILFSMLALIIQSIGEFIAWVLFRTKACLCALHQPFSNHSVVTWASVRYGLSWNEHFHVSSKWLDKSMNLFDLLHLIAWDLWCLMSGKNNERTCCTLYTKNKHNKIEMVENVGSSLLLFEGIE